MIRDLFQLALFLLELMAMVMVVLTMTAIAAFILTTELVIPLLTWLGVFK